MGAGAEPPSPSRSASWASCPWAPATTWRGCWAGAASATTTPSCCRSWRSWRGPPPRCWTGERGGTRGLGSPPGWGSRGGMQPSVVSARQVERDDLRSPQAVPTGPEGGGGRGLQHPGGHLWGQRAWGMSLASRQGSDGERSRLGSKNGAVWHEMSTAGLSLARGLVPVPRGWSDKPVCWLGTPVQVSQPALSPPRPRSPTMPTPSPSTWPRSWSRTSTRW